jgi:hypothetical protein
VCGGVEEGAGGDWGSHFGGLGAGNGGHCEVCKRLK